jgi:hypothetical protein
MYFSGSAYRRWRGLITLEQSGVTTSRDWQVGPVSGETVTLISELHYKSMFSAAQKRRLRRPSGS